MKLKQLNLKHALYCDKEWALYQALYQGGDALDCHMDHLLPKLAMEPDELYADRIKHCAYTYQNHCSNILNQISNSLFTYPFSIQRKGEGKDAPLPEWYGRFKEDCDRNGTDLIDFAKGRFDSAAVKGMSFWVGELPSQELIRDPQNLALDDWKRLQLGEGWIKPIEAEQLLDYETDRWGHLAWAMVHHVDYPRSGLESERETVRETWRYYDKTSVTTFEIQYPKDKPLKEDQQIPQVSIEEHGFKRVPIVALVIPPGLQLMSRLAGLQITNYRNAAGLHWMNLRTNFPTPVFKVKDGKMPKLGAGYGIAMDIGEAMEWASPDASTFESQLAGLKAGRTEMYRIGNMNEMGLDQNAASIGRSGHSKQIDVFTSETGLNRYGALMREAMQETYDLFSGARGEAIEWDVQGLDRFAIEKVGLSLEEGKLALEVMGPSSTTYRARMMTHLAEQTLSSLPQEDKDTIRKEIEESESAKENLTVIEQTPNETAQDSTPTN